MPGKIAVILLSGGIDSATAAAIARQDGFTLHALSFHYGQRHERELDCAGKVAAFLQAKSHRVIRFDLRAIGGSALTDQIAVPKDRSEADISTGIPITYVPARNTIFLSFALALAERTGVRTAVLAGGVFQNRLLLERLVPALTQSGLRVLVPERLPPNDGGVAFGQAAIAAAAGPVNGRGCCQKP